MNTYPVQQRQHLTQEDKLKANATQVNRVMESEHKGSD